MRIHPVPPDMHNWRLCAQCRQAHYRRGHDKIIHTTVWFQVYDWHNRINREMYDDWKASSGQMGRRTIETQMGVRPVSGVPEGPPRQGLAVVAAVADAVADGRGVVQGDGLAHTHRRGNAR